MGGGGGTLEQLGGGLKDLLEVECAEEDWREAHGSVCFYTRHSNRMQSTLPH